MRKKAIKGILHDLLRFRIDFNPIANKIFLIKRLDVNLLSGEIFYAEEDDVYEFYKDKMRWFGQRIKSLGVQPGELSEAKIMVTNSKEKIFISYKGEVFEDEISW